ncbi:hypothetical protein [Massilia aerilata]|uniref:Uncharacterized protein n=1 Tax=Massilia aerilata TaxID=453817 RepID=A0ABW0RU16_9BURK
MSGRTATGTGSRLCSRLGLASVLFFAAAASALAEDSCSFMAPDPVLRPHAYPGQTLNQPSRHSSTETVRPHAGLRIAIRQDGCADFVTTRFTLTVARGRERERSEDEWIDFARAEVAGLKIREPQRLKELDAFLARAHGIARRKSERAICRDGSAPDAGDCSWDSLGGYTVSVKRGRKATTISVTEYVSA